MSGNLSQGGLKPPKRLCRLGAGSFCLNTFQTAGDLFLDLSGLIDGIFEAGGDGDLFALGRAGLAAHPCVGPDRVEFVLPGCAIYAAIRQVWPLPCLTVADRGLREGMLLRMMRADRGNQAHRRRAS
jgi:hypothetical protein